ncbi:TIR domain-containing protein [Mycoplasmopsis synoviae]|uniref:TIR domain-containing protein n=1 Tax=Mycoplasmopsis synoviae TaxID=2109 RepID=UPI001C595A0A|nr:TIR domain-containing protein [Mycoplasmopsis synoviae]QXV99735.1 nucleotide-binding protein [Mycoplasmopsis synoviae]UBM43927.1 nucleotide-binding protein [Mycoplasmopsis synoviae]UZW64066.1 nucleotide-binding protein [Mycoplasmopsis synoviae]
MAYFYNKEKILQIKEILKNNGFVSGDNIGNVLLQAKKDNLTINFFNNGKYYFQNSNNKELEEKISSDISFLDLKEPDLKEKDVLNIYIIHGNRKELHLELSDILWTLKEEENIQFKHTKTMDQQVNGTSILEAVLSDMKKCDCVFAILANEDVCILNNQTQSKRARQNVFIEIGMWIGLKGSNSLYMLRQKETEIPSDLNGYLYKEFNENINELKAEIKNKVIAWVKEKNSK